MDLQLKHNENLYLMQVQWFRKTQLKYTLGNNKTFWVFYIAIKKYHTNF